MMTPSPTPRDPAPSWWLNPRAETQHFAVWLLPNKDESAELQNVVDKLSIEHEAPKFLPHVTAFAGTANRRDALDAIVPVVAADVAPFQLRVSKLWQSDAIMQTVVIGFDGHESLDALCGAIGGALTEPQSMKLNPHLSLIYKEMSQDQRASIIRELGYEKDTITFDRVCVCAPALNDWFDFGSWSTFLETPLGK